VGEAILTKTKDSSYNHFRSRSGTAAINSGKILMFKADKNNLAYIGKKPGGEKRDSDAWFTPKRYVEMVRGALGGSIDFDPFSCKVAQETVKAKNFYTVNDDALRTPWPKCNTVFMNPPYSKGTCALAIQAFTASFDQGKFRRGIVLVNNATDTTWWASLTNHNRCVSLCLTHGRIGFENADGKAVSGNTRGQAFILFQAGAQQEIRDARKQFKLYFDNPVVGKVWS
jgi:phage N-6-adenine-methyltransferase